MREYQMLEDIAAFLEDSLDQPITIEDICQRFFVSRALLYRLFSETFHVSIKQYLTKRRICKAAEELISTNLSTLDAGLKYQFQNPETFSRAFRRVFDMPPSRFRVSQTFTDLHPRKQIHPALLNGERRSPDTIFQLSGCLSMLRRTPGGYVVVTDIQRFQQVNTCYGHETGDLALAHVARRAERCSSKADGTPSAPLFRVDGDTFAIIAKDGLQEALQIASRLKALNTSPASLGGYGEQAPLDLSIPLWMNVLKIPTEEQGETAFLTLLEQVIADARQLPFYS